MPKKTLRAPRAEDRTDRQGKPVSNRILLELPDSEYRAIRPYLYFFLSCPELKPFTSPINPSSFFISPTRG